MNHFIYDWRKKFIENMKIFVINTATYNDNKKQH